MMYYKLKSFLLLFTPRNTTRDHLLMKGLYKRGKLKGKLKDQKCGWEIQSLIYYMMSKMEHAELK